MKRDTIRKMVAIVAAMAIVGVGVNAFAGKGYGRMGWGSPGYGPCQGQGDGACQGSGYATNLNEEDAKKIEELRNAFLESTSDLRQEMRQRRLSLASEMAKKDPDAAVAKSLLKEISDLRSQLAEMRVDHMLEMKKINPDMGGRWMSGAMGFGPGYGKGFGPRGGGGCRQ